MSVIERIHYFKEALLRKVLATFFFIFLVPFSGWPQAPDVPPEKAFSMAFSANVQGEVEPCG